MEKIADELRNGGFRATTPVREEGSLDWSALSSDQAIAAKRQFLIGYFDKIRGGDAVLIVNIKKHGIEGYVGANTLMEAACGVALGKPVFYFNDLGNQSCRLEALAVSAGILKGDAGKITHLLAPKSILAPEHHL